MAKTEPCFLIKLENIWTAHPLIISSLLGLVTSWAYWAGFITNVRNTIAHIVVFVSLIIGVLGVFLTLLVTLRESPIFARLREFYPEINRKLFLWIRNQLWSGILVVLLSVLISLFPTPTNKLLSAFGFFIWSTTFWHVGLGSFYTVKLVTDLILKNDRSLKQQRKE